MQSKRTPLYEALRRNNEEVVEILVKAGANVNIVSYYEIPFKLSNVMNSYLYNEDRNKIIIIIILNLGCLLWQCFTKALFSMFYSIKFNLNKAGITPRAETTKYLL